MYVLVTLTDGSYLRCESANANIATTNESVFPETELPDIPLTRGSKSTSFPKSCTVYHRLATRGYSPLEPQSRMRFEGQSKTFNTFNFSKKS